MPDNPVRRYHDRFTISNQPWEIEDAVDQLVREEPLRFLYPTMDDRHRIRNAILMAKATCQPSELRERVLAVARKYLQR